MKATSQLLSLFLIILVTSCSSSQKAVEELPIEDGYTSIFPNKETSDELETISKSLVLINNLTFYHSYLFLDSAITKRDLKVKDVADNAMMMSIINKTSSGTGTIIGINGNNVSLLTAAHIVSYPDTIISYYSKDGKSTDYIESVMIKNRQNLYSNLPEGGRLKIIAHDDKTDIAIVGNTFKDINSIHFPLFNFKLGHADELSWGDFVYVFGYPMHNKIVTRGIVSMPNSDDLDNFMVDALINRGSSGGLVLAIHGSIPNFELVGIVSSVPAEKRFILSPSNIYGDLEPMPGTIYDGEMTIGKLDGIRYGIGRIVSSEAIRKFLIEKESELLNKGYVITLD